MTKYTLNKLARIRIETPPTISLLVERRTYELPNSDVLNLLLTSDTPRTIDEIVSLIRRSAERPGLDRLVRNMIDARILVAEEEDDEVIAEAKIWHSYGWTDALIFHMLTSDIPRSDVPGCEQYENPQATIGETLHRKERPPLWKHYETTSIRLEKPAELPRMDLADVLLSRRSHKPWSGNKVSRGMLSSILDYGNIPLVTSRKAVETEVENDPTVLLRNTFGDLESYVAIHNVDGVPPGIYHYGPDSHTLSLLEPGSHGKRLQDAFVGQSQAGGGAFAVLISLVWNRIQFKYPNNSRAYRSAMIVVGQLAQRYLIAMTQHQLSTFITPAHNVQLQDPIIKTSRFDESLVYLVSAG